MTYQEIVPLAFAGGVAWYFATQGAAAFHRLVAWIGGKLHPAVGAAILPSVPAAVPAPPPLKFTDSDPVMGGGFGGTIQKAWERALLNGSAVGKTKVQYGLLTLASLSGLSASDFGLNESTPFEEIERVYAADQRIGAGDWDLFLKDANPKIAEIAATYKARAATPT